MVRENHYINGQKLLSVHFTRRRFAFVMAIVNT